jgi:hypothetical protein
MSGTAGIGGECVHHEQLSVALQAARHSGAEIFIIVLIV